MNIDEKNIFFMIHLMNLEKKECGIILTKKINLLNLFIDEIAMIAKYLSLVDRLSFFRMLWDAQFFVGTDIINAFESLNLHTSPPTK